ncbi:MAG: hypothetical protein AB7J40_01560 [Candidatus Altimarinota bacterium]
MFNLPAWVFLLLLGLILMGGTSIAIVIRSGRTVDDGLLDFQNCTFTVQQERRNNRALLFLGLGGFWLVVASFLVR